MTSGQARHVRGGLRQTGLRKNRKYLPALLHLRFPRFLPVLHAMRLFILPISTKHNLIYCARVHQHLPTKEKATYIDRLSRKAATTWLTWEQHNKGWQKVVTTYGNKLFQNLPHEEWGLKSIPPLTARRISSKLNSKDAVRLEFPSSWIKEDAVTESLRYFGGKAKYAYHTKWMWGSIIGMPISAPLALIPM